MIREIFQIYNFDVAAGSIFINRRISVSHSARVINRGCELACSSTCGQPHFIFASQLNLQPTVLQWSVCVGILYIGNRQAEAGVRHSRHLSPDRRVGRVDINGNALRLFAVERCIDKHLNAITLWVAEVSRQGIAVRHGLYIGHAIHLWHLFVDGFQNGQVTGAEADLIDSVEARRRSTTAQNNLVMLFRITT